MTWLLALIYIDAVALLLFAALGVADKHHHDAVATSEPVVRIPQQRGRHHPPGWSR